MAEFTKRRWMAFCRVVMVILCVAASPLSQGYEGSAFEAIRTLLLQDPYAQLPHYEVTGTLFGPSGGRPENRLRAAAIRTLSNNADVFDFPAGQKLFQPNGICFMGRWEIDQGSPYDGYFSNPSRGLLIVRASVTLSETQRGARRAFALAGKLFPTLDRTAVVHTANFFCHRKCSWQQRRAFLGCGSQHSSGHFWVTEFVRGERGRPNLQSTPLLS